MEEQATLAELDAEAGRIADSAYSADFDAEPPIKDLVRRAVLMERERCARVCDERAEDCESDYASDRDERWLVYAKHAKRLASAIRSGLPSSPAT